MPKIRLLLFLFVIICSKNTYSISLIYLESADFEWINKNTVKTKNNESLVFYLDYNDCFNCNLLLNHVFKNGKINFKEINLILNGIPEFKLKEFLTEYSIPKDVNVKIDNGLFSNLSERNKDNLQNGISGYYRIFSNGLLSFHSLKSFSDASYFNKANSSYKDIQKSVFLNDGGQFFTGINKTFEWNNNLLVLTNPNGKLLLFSKEGEMFKQIILNDTIIVTTALSIFKNSYSDAVINGQKNSPTNVLSNFQKDIKPLGFNMVTFSSISVNDQGNLDCLIYVRIPIEKTDSQMVLDNAVVFVEIDKSFLIKNIYPVEIPKLQTHVINDADGYAKLDWNENLITSFYSINKMGAANNQLGEWIYLEGKFKFNRLINLESLDSSFMANFYRGYKKKPSNYKFDIVGEYMKFRDIAMVLNLKSNVISFDNCIINKYQIYRIFVGASTTEKGKIYNFIEFNQNKIFHMTYNSNNKLQSCNPIDLDIKITGLKILLFQNQLHYIKTTDKGFLLSKLNLIL
jgi:hypothetical protein